MSTYGNESYAAKMAGRRNRLLENDSAKPPVVDQSDGISGDDICQIFRRAISKALHPIDQRNGM